MSAFPASPDRSAGFRVPLARPQLGQDELDAVAEVFASGALTNGPAVRRFEAQFAEAHRAAHGVAFGNGTVALAAMYLAAGIRPGDEVIVPSMTFISSATSLLHVGARPVFADIDPETLNLDPGDVARRIGPDTRAILVVHYGGQPADLDRLVELAEANELILLEDAAEAHGVTFQGSPVGTFGLGGMFSFTPTKNMTTGEGGMVVTNDESYAHGLRILRNHGQENGGPVETLGYNWRMSDILAAVGSVQLLRLPFVLKRLRQLAERLDAGVAPLPRATAPVVRPDRDHTYMLYTVQVDGDRDDLRQHLCDRGIEARYFVPAHQHPLFRSEGGRGLPVTDRLAERILSLPLHASLGDEEVDEVVDEVSSWCSTRA